MRGFMFVAALIFLAAAILAQPILLEINTNFTSHKLEPQGSFISKDIKVRFSKSLGGLQILKPKVPLVIQSGVYRPNELTLPFAFPTKTFAAKISEKKVLNFAKIWFPIKHFSGNPEARIPFLIKLPNIPAIKRPLSFASISNQFKGIKAEDLNVRKEIQVAIKWKPTKQMRSSLAILEMKKKISAYSPLGGLETIGKYLEESKYAFWGNQNYLGMEMSTPLMSNWVAYDYHKSQISNLSLAFRAGPFSTLFSMKEGNVKGSVQTGWGFSFGGTVSSDSTVSIFSTLPISIGNFKSFVGGEYTINSSPTIFHPSVIVEYEFGDFIPYASYSYQNDVPLARIGFTKGNFSLDGSMTLENTSEFGLSFKYFSPFGIAETDIGWNEKEYGGKLNFSSAPFGFDPIQFSVDTSAYVNSSGNYEVDGKINTIFKFFFSYVSTWIKGSFTGIKKPAFSYGAEVDF